MELPNYRTLFRVSGVYLVEYPDRIKIGLASTMRTRARAHGQQGALRMRGWSAPYESIQDIEDQALQAAARVGRQIRRTESFTGLTFGQGCDLMRSVVQRATGGPVHEFNALTTDVVTPGECRPYQGPAWWAWTGEARPA